MVTNTSYNYSLFTHRKKALASGEKAEKFSQREWESNTGSLVTRTSVLTDGVSQRSEYYSE